MVIYVKIDLIYIKVLFVSITTNRLSFVGNGDYNNVHGNEPNHKLQT